MRTSVLGGLLVAAVLSMAAPALAQEPEREQPRSGNTSEQSPGQRGRFQMANVRIELTVTDSAGAAGAQKKTVSMIIADGQMGRIRAQRHAGNPATLNVDATPVIMNDRVRLQVSLEYTPPTVAPNSTRLASVTEIVVVLLEPGKPTMISQSADPSADRKVTVEVTATVLK